MIKLLLFSKYFLTFSVICCFLFLFFFFLYISYYHASSLFTVILFSSLSFFFLFYALIKVNICSLTFQYSFYICIFYLGKGLASTWGFRHVRPPRPTSKDWHKPKQWTRPGPHLSIGPKRNTYTHFVGWIVKIKY